MRITHTLSLLMRGDFNADGIVDANDIPGFKQTFYSPKKALRKDFYAADMNGDGIIDNSDATCFYSRIYNGGPICDPNSHCFLGALIAEGGGMNSSTPAGGGDSPDPHTALDAWDDANPRPDCLPGSVEELAWMNARDAEMVSLGLMSQAEADGLDLFNTWQAANSRDNHPELSDAQYAALVADAFSTFLGSTLGG